MNQTFDLKEFTKKLKFIDYEISDEDSETIFNFIDTKFSKKIQIKEFFKWIEFDSTDDQIAGVHVYDLNRNLDFINTMI